MSIFSDLPRQPAAAAIELAARGLSVFPCSAKTKAPLIERGFLAATQDPHQVARWWRQFPDALIGLPTGEKNNIFVLDIDAKHGAVEDILDELEAECDEHFQGPRVRTLNKGLHCYFRDDARLRIGAGRFRQGVDWRGRGGYVIAPDGRRYHLELDGELKPPPEKLVEKILSAQSNGPRLEAVSGGLEAQLAASFRNDTAALVSGITGDEGQWHDSMVRLVWRLVQRGHGLDDIAAFAPLFQRPGYSLEQTQREVLQAARGAYERQGVPPTGLPLGPADGAAELRATPFDPDFMASLRPRDWIYGHLAIRRFISIIGAPGGTGKTAYATGVALSIASGRPLLGEKVHKRGRVWIYNLEDPLDEIYRRLEAAMRAHGLKVDDVRDNLMVSSGREQKLCIAMQTKEHTAIVTPHRDQMISELKEKKIDVIFVDPFVKSHALEENRNEHIDAAATAWSDVGEAANAAPILVHHFRKGGGSDADAFRGASALVDAARCAVSLSIMSEAEAERLGVDAAKRARLVRLDNAKLNLAPRPEEARWLELVGVQIRSGDHVQAMTPWAKPSVFDGVSVDECNAILDIVEAGCDGLPWAPSRQAGDRWAGRAILRFFGERGEEKTEGQAAEMLRMWLGSGCLQIIDFHTPQRKTAKGLRVVSEYRPGADF